MDEHNCGQDLLWGLLTLAKGLRRNNKCEVINIHSGYFSTLLAGNAGGNILSGISHGPEFGESRSVAPVGGGIPTSRYYVPQLHNRIRYREAVRILRAKGYLNSDTIFHEAVCKCAICKEVIDSNVDNFSKFGTSNVKIIPRSDGFVRRQFPTSEAKELCLKHYLLNKVEEINYSITESKDRILDGLEKAYLEYLDVMDLNEVIHLKIWQDILRKNI